LRAAYLRILKLSLKLSTDTNFYAAFRALEPRLPQIGIVECGALKPSRGKIHLPHAGAEQYGAFEPAVAQ
jgi:hypothetical protein